PAPTPPPPDPARPIADVDGDGCAEVVVVGSDGTVSAGGHTFTVAADPSDQVLVGDWDCDGRATMAVVRLPSGAVDAFAAWPRAADGPLVATRTTEVAGALAAEVAAGPAPGCAAIAVHTAAGVTVVTVAAPTGR